MSTAFSDDDREDLERLLGGQVEDVRSPRLRRLAGLLGAAAGPPRPHELRGEDDALAAFRTARRTRPAAARRSGMYVPAIKVAVAVTAAVVVGSTAAAMAAGLVPNPLVDFGRPILTHSATEVSSPDTPGTTGLRSPSVAPPPPATAPPGVSVPPVVGLPVPSLPSPATHGSSPVADLCTWYRALDESQRPQALADPALAPLITLAGGAELVDTYCDGSSESSSASPSAAPSPAPSPTPSPSLAPSTSTTPPPTSPPPSESPSPEVSSTATRAAPDGGPTESRKPPWSEVTGSTPSTSTAA